MGQQKTAKRVGVSGIGQSSFSAGSFEDFPLSTEGLWILSSHRATYEVVSLGFCVHLPGHSKAMVVMVQNFLSELMADLGFVGVQNSRVIRSQRLPPKFQRKLKRQGNV